MIQGFRWKEKVNSLFISILFSPFLLSLSFLLHFFLFLLVLLVSYLRVSLLKFHNNFLLRRDGTFAPIMWYNLINGWPMDGINLEQAVNQVHEFRRESFLVSMFSKHCFPENIRSIFKVALVEGISFLGTWKWLMLSNHYKKNDSSCK